MLGFAGLKASGVSFWAVVSRLTSTTTAPPAPKVLKLGAGVRVIVGASWQAASNRLAPMAAVNEGENRMQGLRVKRFIWGR